MTRPAAIRPSVRGSPQPQLFACEIASSGSVEAGAEHERAADVDPARRAHGRLRDQQLASRAAATAAIAAPSQKIMW